MRKKVAKELMTTIDSSSNVAVPTYTFDKVLQVWREKQPPKNEIFKVVGYNTQEKVAAMMKVIEEVPEELRGAQRKQSKRRSTVTTRRKTEKR